MLADIELAQTLQATPEQVKKAEEILHPLDRDYQLLKCQLQRLGPEEPEYKVHRALPVCPPSAQGGTCSPAFSPRVSRGWELRALGDQGGSVHTPLPWHPASARPQVIQTYLEQTGNKYRQPALQHVWKVNRDGEVRQSPSSPLQITALSLREMTWLMCPLESQFSHCA